MENYILEENETILYRGNAILLSNGKKEDKHSPKIDVLLTNLNFVISVTKKKLFKTLQETTTYSVSDVKIYNDAVQVIRRKTVVDIYLKGCELFLDFEKEKEAKLFCDKALRLISGESKVVRSVKRFKKEINETNEALDIDIGDIAKKGAVLAATSAIGIASLEGAGKKSKILGKIAEAALGAKSIDKTQPLPPAKTEDN